MKLAKVIGSVTATRKTDSFQGLKILVVQPLDEKLEPSGEPLAALDSVQAGYGDIVYITLARESAFALPDANAPSDAVITGIVDAVSLDGREHEPPEVFLPE